MALTAEAILAPLAVPLLRGRLARGKEDPARWREKLGEPSAPRPNGPLIWLHAVGLGEVMALRGLIENLGRKRPEWQFLVTSTARASGSVFAGQLPPRCRHQFLPLDLPGPVARFLDHWQPDLAVWSEQDLWPRLITQSARRGIPLALVNGRMDDRALASRKRVASVFADLLALFAVLLMQDEASARNLQSLAPGLCVSVTGSLKAGAPVLPVDPATLDAARRLIGDRPVWAACSTHPEDEEVSLDAHRILRSNRSDALLIIVPRHPERGHDIARACAAAGLSACLRSTGQIPGRDTAVWIADSFGELGLWYRLIPVALIGGGFSAIEGHNPWEAVSLDCAVLHGPRTANFKPDFEALSDAEAAICVTGSTSLATALARDDLTDYATRARAVLDAHARAVDETATALTGLVA